MGQLEELENFVRIADAGGIGRAAELTGLPKSVVSRRLTQLEARLGAQLLARTTRRWHLTEAGETCYQQALRLLDANAELQHAVNPDQTALSGRLRVAAPLSFGQLHLPHLLYNFSQRHPELELDLQLSDHRINLLEEGVDLTLRIGKLHDSGLRARWLAPITFAMVASPEYLARAGKPNHPDDLRGHRILNYNASRDLQPTLHGPNNEEFVLSWDSHFHCNNGDLLNSMALLGYGIALSPRFICWQDLAQGRLVPVLPQYQLPAVALYALYPAGRYTPRKVRVFLDHLRESFDGGVYWELGNL